MFFLTQATDKSSSPRLPQPAAVRPATPGRLVNSPVASTPQRLMVIPGQQGIPRTVNPVSAINQTVGAPGEQQYTLQIVPPPAGNNLFVVKLLYMIFFLACLPLKMVVIP